MISGNKKRRILSYVRIDHSRKGMATVLPFGREEFWGVPYGMLTDNSWPFIEVHKDGIVTQTVNAYDLAHIQFQEDC